jgi:uncharacterized protein YrrD
MAVTGKVYRADAFIGRTVLSRATANQLGQVHDLIIEPVAGDLAGLEVKTADGVKAVEYSEIYSIGPDAVMVNNDRSVIATESSPLNVLPTALNKLVGAEVITEGGQVLGHVATIFMCLAEEPVLIYEARASILDKLLGRSLFFLGSQGHAFSAGDARLVVKEDTAEKADSTLEALAGRLFGPAQGDDPVVVIRSRGH